MKSIVTILAASAALSLSLAAGLAAPRAGAADAAMPAPAWIDPPARTNGGCRDAVWPYRAPLCADAAPAAGSSAAPARKVRVIAALGAPADALRGDAPR